MRGEKKNLECFVLYVKKKNCCRSTVEKKDKYV